MIGALPGTLGEFAVVQVGYRLVGLALLSGGIAALSAFLFRWRTGNQLPDGAALLLGLGSVAVYLNGRIALVQFLGGSERILDPVVVGVNLVTLVVSAITAIAGWQLGDSYGSSKRLQYSLNPRISPLVRATGRFIVVELPEDIADIDGYDPVAPAVKADLAGKSYTFSRGLTIEELQAALSTKLQKEHAIGQVDAEVTVEGEVTFLAVGDREAGIGPTLPPSATATAITADPALTASPGDTVQIWQGERRIGTAELRAAAGSTATVSARRSVIDSLDPDTRYRLMTLPVDERADRLFASMLRQADETMSSFTVTEGATLDGEQIGRLGLTVVAVEQTDGTTETIPQRGREIEAGEKLFVIGNPGQLRRVEAAATGTGTYEPPAADDPEPEPRRTLRFWRRRR
ncbi:potassium transporter TrkA [Halovenus sp. WSH3]|uniref:Potassium transporter TrkA n=1 Tax=Halovenus carboxidivorans TaxID=2692199 RepID=A0A6B0T0B1_9EURY|nr:TrkA C-terminal domain-containing protein [Halovenus carboxidivorans]MXR50667.1 potassium transporter TrkA [Halovenus carboxidivorans]